MAYIWVGPLSDVAPAFADHDDLPPPFCPMYPNARDLVASGETALPHQLTKIINRVKAEVEQTPTWTRAAQCAAELELEDVQTLHAAKKRFQEQAGGVQGETLNQWQERIHGLLEEAKSDVPEALILIGVPLAGAGLTLPPTDFGVLAEICRPVPGLGGAPPDPGADVT